MDTSALAWFSDTVSSMEDPFLYDECDILDFLDDGAFAAEQLEIFQSCISPNTNTNSSSTLNIQTSISTNTLAAAATTSTDSPPVTTAERPTKQRKTNNHDSSKPNKKAKNHKVSSSPVILTFGNPTVSKMNPQQVILGSLNTEDDAASSEVFNSRGPLGTNNNVRDAAVRSPTTPKKSGGGGRSRPASQTYDHIIAERKRREQLSQRFLALSRLVPGLKKVDKSSVLGETIKYLKQLQDRVKTLEEQSTKQRVESFVLVKKSSRPLDEDEEGSSDEMGCNNDDDQELSLPQIEAKLCDKHVLLRVHCEKDKKALINVLTAVENLNLSITSTSFIPFGSLAFDITITAEKPKEFNLTMKELVKSLQSALRHPMEAN